MVEYGGLEGCCSSVRNFCSLEIIPDKDVLVTRLSRLLELYNDTNRFL